VVKVEYTTVKVHRVVKEKLASYAKLRALTLGAAISRLLEEESLRSLLSQIVSLLEEQNRLIVEIKCILAETHRGKTTFARRETVQEGVQLDGFPEFIRDNPWLDVLSRRGQNVQEKS